MVQVFHHNWPEVPFSDEVEGPPLVLGHGVILESAHAALENSPAVLAAAAIGDSSLIVSASIHQVQVGNEIAGVVTMYFCRAVNPIVLK